MYILLGDDKVLRILKYVQFSSSNGESITMTVDFSTEGSRGVLR